MIISLSKDPEREEERKMELDTVDLIFLIDEIRQLGLDPKPDMQMYPMIQGLGLSPEDAPYFLLKLKMRYVLGYEAVATKLEAEMVAAK